MIKRVMFLFLLPALCGMIAAQSVVSVAGGSTDAMTWTVGEVFTESVLRSNVVRFSQGFNQPVAVSPSGILNVSDKEMIFTAFPNPVVDLLQVTFSTDDTCTWRLYDLRGALLNAGEATGCQAEIDFSDRAAGKYMLEITNGAAKRSVMVIKN